MKPLLTSLLFICLGAQLQAQSSDTPSTEGGDGKDRVQYTLVLPEEKTPEYVKPEENSPFEAHSDEAKQEGDTEENRVRDILVRMTAVGGGSGPDGMRVMLGSMRLEAGQMVPPVLPDQQVMLKVKSVSPTAIELVWVEKKPTGLPPKPFVIPVDVSPRVRYRMPAGGGAEAGQGGGIGTVRREGFSAFSPKPEEQPDVRPAQRLITKAQAVEDRPAPAPKAPTPAPANVPEASVLRMLFGNHAPQGK